MAQTPEGRVKDKAKALYKQHGAKYDRATQTGMGQNGRADDIVCRAGHFAGVEFKRDAVWKVSALQRIWLLDAEANGGSSMVVNLVNLDMLAHWLQARTWRVNARFANPDKPDTCTGHVATCMVTGQTHHIKNPGGKPGK